MDVSSEYENRFARAVAGLNDTHYDNDESDSDDHEIVETVAFDTPLPKQAQARPTTINLFQHPDAHPLVLDLALLRRYGPEWMEWEPETLELRIPQDFRTTSVSDLNMEKIQAVKTMHFVDSFWERWEVFVWCTMPLNGEFADFEYAQVPTAAQCMVSVDIANRIRTDVPWSEELKAFVSTAFFHDGILCPVAPCDFIEIDTSNLIVDCAEVSKRWVDVRLSGKAPVEEEPVAEQLRRLLVLNEYLEESRDRLRLQLPSIDYA